MKITIAQNQLNKYLDKGQEIRFEEENNIKQTDKQVFKKTTVEDNYFQRFINASAKLTENQYYSLKNVNDLEFSYEEMLQDFEYSN